MNNYVGKICPYCKTEFKPDDDIVVCSECDMPHHKDCWIENQGCTTFGCLGTIKKAGDNNNSAAVETNPEDGQSVVYCTKCGAQNVGTALFCSKCGNRLTTPQPAQAPVFQQSTPYAYANLQGAQYQQQNNYTAGGYTDSNIDADIQTLVGAKAEYYIPKFQEMKVQNKKSTWNWSAFLFTPYWMIYRKMYAYGAGMLGISAVLTLIIRTVGSILAFCGYIVLGIFGNYIYMNFLEKKAAQMKAMNEPYKTQFAVKNGGVNTTAVILSAVGYSLLLTIIFFVSEGI